MNVSFSIILVAEIIAVITQTEAFFGWRWSSKSKYKRWNSPASKTDHGCSSGQCVEAWKCPKDAISQQSTGSCAYWKNGAMVCCMLTNDEISHHWGKTNDYSFESTIPTADVYSKRTATNSRNQKSRTTTQNYIYNGEDHLNTPCVEEPWNRNARPTPISSLGDIFKNAHDRFTTHRAYTKVTKIQPVDGWKKTTEAIRNKETSVPQSMRTTKLSNKPHTLESRIIFPTESVRITKVTKHPIFTTSTLKRITDNKPLTKSWASSSTTSKAPWGYTTRYTVRTTSRTTRSPYFKPSAPTTASTYEDRINNGWGKSTKVQPARGQTSKPKSTNKPSFTQSTTRSQISRPKTTNRPSFTQSTTRGQTSKPKTTNRPSFTRNTTTGQTAKPKSTSRPSFTRSTTRTTKRQRITTPLPNVNTFLCGIRDQIPLTIRQGRNYNEKNPAIDVIYSDTAGSKARVPYQRIVGGEEVEPFSWPWVAALYKVTSSGGNRFLSAGSLINEKFILTAAHVFTPEDLRTASYVVMLGTHDAQDAVAEYLVSSVLQHPRYEHRYYYHDIALLRLEKPVVFNNYVMPVCLPSPNAPLLRDRDLEGKNVTVMGWGDDSFGGKSSRVLKEATFPIASRSSCNASYVRVASNRFPKGITDNMLCAGDPNGGKDACQGDSGGPLTSMENGRYTQVGIVSFGYQCGDKEFPGVYTKVAPYLSWIAENTQQWKDYINDYD